MRPRPELGRWSTYTVLGLIGYAVAAIAIGVIGAVTDTSLAERLFAVVLPPFGFWIAIWIELRMTGVERIVFYRTAIAAWGLTTVCAFACGMRLAVVSDLVVVLIGAFLTFGRVGCFHVACCHGRPGRFGVRYTNAHARVGFPRRLVGRSLLPVQLFESLASALLTLAAIVAIKVDSPGTASALYVVGYANVRFVLELLRGDGARAYIAGVSEAQWIGLATTAAVAGLASSVAHALIAGLLAVATIACIIRKPAFVDALRAPRHLDELERVHRMLARQRESGVVATSAGLRVSVRSHPSGLLDLLWSHDRLDEHDVRALAQDLALDGEVVSANTAGMYHVLVPVSRPAALPDAKVSTGVKLAHQRDLFRILDGDRKIARTEGTTSRD